MPFILLALIFIFLIYFINLAEKGTWRKLRLLPAITAIEEMVGRATEMGRPVHFTPGEMAQVVGELAPASLAGLEIGKFVAKVSAEKGAEFFATIAGKQGPQITILFEELVKSAFISAGEPEKFKPEETVRFISDVDRAHVAAMTGIFQREKVASSIQVGAFGGTTMNLIGAAHSAGAMVLYGNIRQAQMMWAVGLADHILIGEEIYAAAAYLSEDPVLLGSISVQDVGKWIVTALIMITFIMSIVGLNVGFLKW